LHVDDDGVFTIASGAGDETMSQIARAIRRFSTERAHEQWAECAIAIERLSGSLERASQGREQVALCLGCAVVEIGKGAVQQHLGNGCVAVELSAPLALSADDAPPQGMPDMLLRIIEGFRLGRAALALPHYELDCYIARGQVIFTWRPLLS
jgi:hypothetical protein